MRSPRRTFPDGLLTDPDLRSEATGGLASRVSVHPCGAPGAVRAPARLRHAAGRRGARRARHRHGDRARCRGEAVRHRQRRGARAAPLEGNAGARRGRRRSPRSKPTCAAATSATAPAPKRRCARPTDAVVLDTSDARPRARRSPPRSPRSKRGWRDDRSLERKRFPVTCQAAMPAAHRPPWLRLSLADSLALSPRRAPVDRAAPGRQRLHRTAGHRRAVPPPSPDFPPRPAAVEDARAAFGSRAGRPERPAETTAWPEKRELGT